MGDGQARRYDGRVRRYFTPRCIGLHVTILVVLVSFGWLTAWQLGRALGCNTLSWAYTFEWPLFAGYAVYVWWQLVHDQTTAVTRRIVPASKSGDGAGDDYRQPGWALSGGRKKNIAIAASAPKAFAHDDAIGSRRPLSRLHAALRTRRLVASMRIFISASMAWMSWCCAMGTPNVFRSLA